MAWYSRRWYLLFSGSQMRLKVLMVVKEVPEKIRCMRIKLSNRTKQCSMTDGVISVS